MMILAAKETKEVLCKKLKRCYVRENYLARLNLESITQKAAFELIQVKKNHLKKILGSTAKVKVMRQETA